MRSVRPSIVAVAIASILAAGSFVAGSRVAERSGSPFQAVIQAAEEIHDEAAAAISEAELVQAAIRGMLEALGDPYADLLGPSELGLVQDLIDGSIVGIGVWLQHEPGGLRIATIVPDSPAQASGLRAGDLIVAIDGHATRGVPLAQSSRRIQGAVGSVVQVDVRRDGETLSFRVVRKRIGISDVQAWMLDGDIAYARVLQFGGGVAEELRMSMNRLLDAGATRVLLDLRDNPGGLAREAVGVASLFIEDGVIARLVERGQPRRDVFAEGEALPEMPLAVLVNGATASAAEVVAGALQDRDRGTIIGTPTFGKGAVISVQEVQGGAIQFTTAQFLTADGHVIEGLGISPDWPILPGGPKDAQLEWAVEVLRGRAPARASSSE
ncbi:MAG: S41 family peptidase [Actinomycetota bacterium]